MNEEKTVKNRHIYFKNADLDYFLQYALACQTYQGSTYGECFYAASQIHEEDLESWVQAWAKVAQKAEIYGRNAEASGHRVSATEAIVHPETHTTLAIFPTTFAEFARRNADAFLGESGH